MTNSDPRRGLVRRLGLAAAAIIALTAATQQRAEALSLVSPGTAPSAKFATDDMTTQVRGHGGGGGGGFRGGGGGGGFRGGGGGGGFHGGGFRGGGAAFHGGGYRAAPVFRGGGGYRAMQYGGYRGYRHVYRPHAYYRPYFHRRHYAPAYYGYSRYYAYPHRYCRVVWTYYGPRKICRYRPFHHHYRHHHRRHYYRF